MACPCDHCECGVCAECERRRGICRVREERSAVTLTPPGAAIQATITPIPPAVQERIERAFADARRQEAADARFDALWNAALGVLAVAALAAVLAACWWPR